MTDQYSGQNHATTKDRPQDSAKYRLVTLWQSLTTVRTNPTNNKCLTLPILRLDNPYSRNFHLSWLGFWVAFLSWFAFSPLVPEAVRTDLKLTQKEIGNSNIISLCATLVVRLIVGPLVDRFGPRKVMAGILLVGSIPSGLAGTISSAQGLHVVRFFIGILGGTFVPCQAWTTAFFDTKVVGRANALVGGWGNSGGGFTFIIMVGLYNRLREDGISAHSAWRAAFAIVPVPILVAVAIVTLVFGTDHPDDTWNDKQQDTRSTGIAKRILGNDNVESHSTRNQEMFDEKASQGSQDKRHGDSEKGITVGVHAVTVPDTETGRLDSDTHMKAGAGIPSCAAPGQEGFSRAVISGVIKNPLTWLPAFAYLTSFGYELAIDANLSNVLFGIYNPTKPGFNQTTSGYIASIYGLLNLFSRPLGGYLGDIAYRKYGVPGRKHLVLLAGVAQGLLSIGLGVYIDRHHHVSASSTPSLAVTIILLVLVALVNEIANGANFSLVPHCNPNSNGFMTGIVGAAGNLGGVWFALMWRYQPQPFGRAFWIAGVVTVVRSIQRIKWGLIVFTFDDRSSTLYSSSSAYRADSY
ncbi:major facilitator superfamily domain-containing protein [Irpex rosettiformis]|uniref:Major facilitator superfamily domain-containing protein n=1 Tax=Irpex rosettiformis TaxID=378272 RepID=A0ACB8TVL5_9APHY|nr:major facilitator superfamily domain-containing protein [Irpex rosettiformis]